MQHSFRGIDAAILQLFASLSGPHAASPCQHMATQLNSLLADAVFIHQSCMGDTTTASCVWQVFMITDDSPLNYDKHYEGIRLGFPKLGQVLTSMQPGLS